MAGKYPPTTVSIGQGSANSIISNLRNPVDGTISPSSGFGQRKNEYHKGIDIPQPTGTPVHAAESGVVTRAEYSSSYGNVVYVDHGDGVETRYAHLSEIDVKKGQKLTRGETLGKVGSTGHSTGPHLHYEVRKDGQPLPPPVSGRVSTLESNSTAQQARDKANAPAPDDIAPKAISKEEEDAIIAGLISGKNYLPNLSNNFNNLTYHWRLYMTSDRDLLESDASQAGTVMEFFKVIEGYPQVTIAESGVTNYSIDDVQMEAVVGTDFQSSSTKYTKISIKITEPNGVRFMDALRAAAVKCQIRDYKKAFYYLELTFKGYTEDGDIDVTPFSDFPNGGRWLWTINITNIDVNLTAGGGTYNLDCIPMADQALTEPYNIVPAMMNINGQTIGDWFDEFTRKTNRAWEIMYGEKDVQGKDVHPLMKFEMAYHDVEDVMTADQVKSMSVIPALEDMNPQSQNVFFTAGQDGYTTHVPYGITVPNVIERIFSVCEKAQDLSTCKSYDTREMFKFKVGREPIFWRVEPETRVTGYSYLYRRYTYRVILHIYGYRVNSLVSDGRTLSTDEQKTVLATIVKRGLLRKKYEYLFTGQNTEVLEMDLSFNLAWSAVLPLLANTRTESAAAQAMVDENQKNRQVLSDLQTAHNNFDQGQDALEQANRTNDPDEQQRLLKDGSSKVASEATVLGKAAGAALNREIELQEQYAPKNAIKRDGSRFFAEDIKNVSVTQDSDPISIEINRSPDRSLLGEFHGGSTAYGIALNQVNGPLTTRFQNVSISVRGDPYWLGPGTFEESIYRKQDTYSDKYPPFSVGANAFVFRLKYPIDTDDNGQIVLDVSEAMTAIYQVNRIQHNFSNGQFTQSLQATRIPIISLLETLGQKGKQEKS